MPTDDLSNDFIASRNNAYVQADSDELDQWVAERETAIPLPVEDSAKDIQGMSLDPFPNLKTAPVEKQSTLGMVARNVGEIGKGVFAGIDSAVNNTAQAIPYMTELEDWLNKNVADLRYEQPKLETETGKITKSLSEFLTGFFPAIKGIKAIGVTNKVASPLLAGAVADFFVRDPSQGRLADLWKQLGLPENVLTEYLSSKEGDSKTEARFKNVLEGAGLGLATQGVLLGARFLRSLGERALRSVKQKKLETDLLTERYGSINDADFKKLLGDPSKPLFQTAARKIKEGADATKDMAPIDVNRLKVNVGADDVYINLARLDTQDDVKNLIQNFANKYKGSIDEARRDVITLKETEELADDLGLSVAELLSRRKGEAFNAETITAARKLYVASGEKLLELTEKAAAPNAGGLDQYAFRRAMATHYAIQAEVLGIQAEAGRALSAFRIRADSGGIEKARAINQIMDAMGGIENSAEIARRLQFLAKEGKLTPQLLSKVAEKSATQQSFSALRELWVNGLLSNPVTHIVNASSNALTLGQSIYERAFAAGIGAIRNTEDRVYIGEVMAMSHGMISSLKDAFRYAGIMFKTGESNFGVMSKIDIPIERAISSSAFNISSSSGVGQFLDLLGGAVNTFGRALGAADEFFKTIAYRGELQAQSYRTAIREGLSGDELKKRYAQILIDTPENLKINSVDFANYITFTGETGNIGKAFLRGREMVPISTLVFPFLKTPVNLTRYSFERTPLAPLVGQWRAELASGGARADLALAKIATGSAIMAIALDWADSGIINGIAPSSKDKGEREAMLRQGWKPNSIKVGNRYYDINRIDTFKPLLFAANIMTAIKRGEVDEDDIDEWQEVAAMTIGVISEQTINKTYLQGVSNLTTALADPTQKSEGYIENLLSSFLPFTALSGALKKTVDPVTREVSDPLEAIQNKIMFLSKNLPPRRNIWGEEIRNESGIGVAYDFISPLQSSEIKPNAIDTEILRLAVSPNLGDASPPSRISKKTSFDGVRVNLKQWPDVYNEYTKLAGNELKHIAWDLGAKDYLIKVVSGQHAMSEVYKTMPDEQKLRFISETISDYRKQAQQQILQNPRFADFASYVKRLHDDKFNRSLPITQ